MPGQIGDTFQVVQPAERRFGDHQNQVRARDRGDNRTADAGRAVNQQEVEAVFFCNSFSI